MSSNPQESDSRWSRITEQVIINVLTAACLAVLAGVLGVLGLLTQMVFHFVVIPTNLLVTLALIGLGMLIVLVIIAGIVALFHRWLGKHPGVAVAILLGFLGALIALRLEDGGTARTELWEALKKAEEGAKTPAAQPLPSTQQPPSV